MTLDTRIYVDGPVDHRELFVRCNQLIGAAEDTRCDDRPAGDGSATIMNEPDQGLPGWLMIDYRPGAPLRTQAQAAAHDEDCDTGCSGEYHRRACWAKVSLDTAYSYRDEFGGCGDLHARFVAALGEWLDGKGIRWGWVNEFTGEFHWGTEGLNELGSGGREAANWMTGTVLPAIAASLEG